MCDLFVNWWWDPQKSKNSKKKKKTFQTTKSNDKSWVKFHCPKLVHVKKKDESP